MCLIVFAWRPRHALPLVLAANRDEFHARPSQPLGAWVDAPDILAGRDPVSGGTWLGVTREGRFAAVTNIRDPRQPRGELSRGTLTEAFLRSGQAPLDYLREVAARSRQYTGFNLLVGDGDTLGHLNSRQGRPQLLAPGLYGLSNASLDTPWPKLARARQRFAEQLGEATPETLFALLADRRPAPDEALPDTGVPLEWERLLSSIFIQSETYGTRASTALIRHADGRQRLRERSFAPDGSVLEEVACAADPLSSAARTPG